jgi:hypothetical protein
MPSSTPPTTRRLFFASLVLFAVSLVFSVTNVVTVFSAPLRTVSVPSQVGFEGYLADAFGSPLNGTHTLTFRLYDVAANGTALSRWSSNVYANVPVTDGLYSVLLDGLPVAGMDDASPARAAPGELSGVRLPASAV